MKMNRERKCEAHFYGEMETVRKCFKVENEA